MGGDVRADDRVSSTDFGANAWVIRSCPQMRESDQDRISVSEA